MSLIERFIIRHKAARYAFVLIGLSLIAARDELARLRHYRPETGMADLLRALSWARAGGEPGWARPRPEPSPIHPKWRVHTGLCVQGPGNFCFEDDFTDACTCWCHQAGPVTETNKEIDRA